MSTGYVPLFDVSGNGLGIASAATTIDFGSRALTTTGSLSGLSGVSATSLTGTLQTASQPNITTLAALTSFGASTTSYTDCVGILSFNGESEVSLTSPPFRISCADYRFAHVFASWANEIPLAGSSTSPSSMDFQTIIDSGTASALRCMHLRPKFGATTFSGQSSGIVTEAVALDVAMTLGTNYAADPGTITSSYGLRIAAISLSGEAMTLTNVYGLRVAQPTTGTNKYTAYFDSGVGIGTTNDSTSTGNALVVAGNVHATSDNSWLGLDTTNPPRVGITKKSTFNAKLTHGSGTNFVIARSSTTNIASAATFTDEVTVDTTGLMTLAVGLSLPTSGGTAATLNHYEELTLSVTFTGIWASNQTANVGLVRVGKVVTLVIPTVTATANTASFVTLTAGTRLPSRFWPALNRNQHIIVQDNGTYRSGIFAVVNNGSLDIYATTAFGNFAGGGSSGIAAGAISWNIQ